MPSLIKACQGPQDIARVNGGCNYEQARWGVMGVAGCQIHSIFWTPLLIEAVANAFKGLRLAGGQVRQIHRIPWVPLLVKAGQGPQDIARVNSGCNYQQPKVGGRIRHCPWISLQKRLLAKDPKINESPRWPSDRPYSLGTLADHGWPGTPRHCASQQRV